MDNLITLIDSLIVTGLVIFLITAFVGLVMLVCSGVFLFIAQLIEKMDD